MLLINLAPPPFVFARNKDCNVAQFIYLSSLCDF
jgi:hypothetical protein